MSSEAVFSDAAAFADARLMPELRLATKVAWMYHEEGRKQGEIAGELRISQSRVSRLLKLATDHGIIRTVVMPPAGVFTDLETAVEKRYGLQECVVVEARGGEQAVLNDLGVAGATFLTSTLLSDEVIGISSWSATWLAVVQSLRPFRTRAARSIVQLVGGIGDARVQSQASLLLDRLARATGGQPLMVQSPGILQDAEARDALLADPSLRAVSAAWDALTVALVGIGSVDPSPLLRESGTVLADVLETVRSLGAVGDVCNHYFDREGRPLRGGVDDRVVGATVEQLQRVPLRVGLAGGERKHVAIEAALRGGWVNVLITDSDTARALLD